LTRKYYKEKHKRLCLESNRGDGLEVNTEKIKYMIVSRHINAGQNHDLLTVNKYSENVANFKFIAK